MSVAWREFSKAVSHLCGPGVQRERLALACGEGLLGLKRKEIPREARAEFDTLVHLLGAEWARDTGAPAVVDRLSDPEVAEAAVKVLAIYDQLTRYEPTRTTFDAMHEPPPGLARLARLARLAAVGGDDAADVSDKQKNDDAQNVAHEEKPRC